MTSLQPAGSAVHTVTPNPTAMMPARPTLRHTALLAVAAAALAAGACSDTSLGPSPEPTLDTKSASLADTTRPSTPAPGTPATPRPDTAQASPAPSNPTPPAGSPRPDSTVAPTPGPGTLWGFAVQNFVIQWTDANGVKRDSAGFRGIAGVTVTIASLASRPDSTSPVQPKETPVATLQTDAVGQFRTAKLPDGWYVVRASGGGKTASATAELLRGNQRPSIVYLNMR